MNRRGPAALCLTGALFVLSYALGTPGYDVPGLPFFCLAPFLSLAVSARSARRAAWRGWVAGTAGNIPIYYWISYTIAVQGKLGWGLGSLAAFLVSAYVGAYFSVAAAAARRLESRFGDRGLWLFPAVWTALEMARSHLFSGFPWMLLGYSVAGSATLRQVADLAGVHGLSFLLALSGWGRPARARAPPGTRPPPPAPQTGRAGMPKNVAISNGLRQLRGFVARGRGHGAL